MSDTTSPLVSDELSRVQWRGDRRKQRRGPHEPPPGDRAVDGRQSERNFGKRVFCQEPPFAGVRQSPQGPPDDRQGGRRQRPGRLRRGRHPAGNLGPHPARRRGPLQSRRAGQRAGHSPPANPPDFRQAAVRLEVPPHADEPRPTGYRHQRRRHVRPADDRQAGEDHVEGLQALRRALLRTANRHQAQPSGDPQRQGRRRGHRAQRQGPARY